MGRRYYLPTEQGAERNIRERLDGLRAVRAAGPPKRRAATGPAVNGMKVGDGVTKAREAARRKIAETEKRDAGG